MSCLINRLSPNPRLQRTRSAPLRSPLSRKPLGVPRATALRRAGRSLVLWAACQVAFGEQPLMDSNRIKSLKELFTKSDAVAVVWMTAGTPELVGGPWFIIRARVNWSFKGVLNNEFIYFRCWEGCQLGERFIVFLKKEGHTLGELEKMDRHVTVSAFPQEAEYLCPTQAQGFPFPVFYAAKLGRKDVVVGLDRDLADLPISIEQGKLDFLARGRSNWWADYDQLKAYLIGLAQDEGARHP